MNYPPEDQQAIIDGCTCERRGGEEVVSSQQCRPPFLSEQWVAETELRLGEFLLSVPAKFTSLRLRWTLRRSARRHREERS